MAGSSFGLEDYTSTESTTAVHSRPEDGAPSILNGLGLSELFAVSEDALPDVREFFVQIFKVTDAELSDVERAQRASLQSSESLYAAAAFVLYRAYFNKLQSLDITDLSAVSSFADITFAVHSKIGLLIRKHSEHKGLKVENGAPFLVTSEHYESFTALILSKGVDVNDGGFYWEFVKKQCQLLSIFHDSDMAKELSHRRGVEEKFAYLTTVALSGFYKKFSLINTYLFNALEALSFVAKDKLARAHDIENDFLGLIQSCTELTELVQLYGQSEAAINTEGSPLRALLLEVYSLNETSLKSLRKKRLSPFREKFIEIVFKKIGMCVTHGDLDTLYQGVTAISSDLFDKSEITNLIQPFFMERKAFLTEFWSDKGQGKVVGFKCKLQHLLERIRFGSSSIDVASRFKKVICDMLSASTTCDDLERRFAVFLSFTKNLKRIDEKKELADFFSSYQIQDICDHYTQCMKTLKQRSSKVTFTVTAVVGSLPVVTSRPVAETPSVWSSNSFLRCLCQLPSTIGAGVYAFFSGNWWGGSRASPAVPPVVVAPPVVVGAFRSAVVKGGDADIHADIGYYNT